MITWTKALRRCGADKRLQAKLLSIAWLNVHTHSDAGTLSNLLINQLTPLGLMSYLDYSGLRTPDNIESIVGKEPRRWPVFVPSGVPV